MAARRVRFVFDVALPQRQVWDIVADTQKVNQLAFGLGATTVVSRSAAAARLRGTFGRFASEYDEYPWSFVVPTSYHSRRVFTRGLLRSLAVDCELAPADGGTTVALGMTIDGASGILGSLAARMFAREVERGVDVLRTVLERAARMAGVAAWGPTNPQRDAVVARFIPVLSALRASLGPDEARILERLVEHVADGTEPDVARIRPYVLADRWGTPRRSTLAVFLRAAAAGGLRLSWDLLCPACEGATTVRTLKDLPRGGHCDACDIDFRADFASNVEATFAPEPAIRSVERLVFCYGSPSSTPSWLAQLVVPAGETRSLGITLGAGRYRLQGQGIDEPVFVEVTEAAGEQPSSSPTFTASVVNGERGPVLAGQGTLTAGPAILVVANTGSVDRRIQLAFRALASQAATAADVTGVGLFQELFGAEALSPDQQVAVGQRAILFTDLVGSTALYEAVGDAAAYGMVRRHFALLGEAIESHGGHIVKTVGDAVMAAFDLPVDGARAGLACILALRRLQDANGQPTALRLRVGVHTGPCLAVDANAHVDYFGRTVNIAARVESLGGADELVLSWTVRAAPDVANFIEGLRAAGHTVVEERRRVKGIADEVEVVRIGVKPS